MGNYKAAVGFQVEGHAIQRLCVWGSSNIISREFVCIPCRVSPWAAPHP